MGLFDGLETPVEDIVVGFGLPNNTYNVIVSDIKKYTHNDVPYIITDYTVQDGPLHGKKHSEWTNLPEPGNEFNEIRGQVLKGTLLALGIPESEIGSFDPDEDKDGVVGVEGILKLVPNKKKPQYQNAYFKMEKGSEPSGPSDVVLSADKNGEPTFDPSQFA